jgi:hypothetical protein
VQVTLGPTLTSGTTTNYMYVDSIQTDAFMGRQAIHDEGYRMTSPLLPPTEGFAGSNNDHCNWDAGQQLDAFMTYYQITGNTYWLDRIVEWGDALLARRDNQPGVGRTDWLGLSRPVWQVTANRYVYVACIGNLMTPLLKFADIVRARGLSAYSTKAGTYAAAFVDAKNAVNRDFHSWTRSNGTVENVYVFDDNPPISSTSTSYYNNPIPANMGAVMAEAHYYMKRWYNLAGDYGSTTAGDNETKLTGFTTYFKNERTATGSPLYYTWGYSNYSSAPEDISHANLEARLAYTLWRDGVVLNGATAFTDLDMQRFAQTLRGTWDGNTYPIYDQVNRTRSADWSTDPKTSTHFFQLIAGALMNPRSTSYAPDYSLYADFLLHQIVNGRSSSYKYHAPLARARYHLPAY